MPLSNETIANRPLSGTEFKARVKADIDKILDRDGIFADYLAYGTVSYRLLIEFQLSNPMMPKHGIEFEARPTVDGVVVPFDEESPDTVALELKREIDSPNAERVAMGLPVKVYSPSGQATEITYPPEIQPERVEPPVEQVQVRKRGRPKGSGL